MVNPIVPVARVQGPLPSYYYRQTICLPCFGVSEQPSLFFFFCLLSSVEGGSTVRAFLDCRWLTTRVLRGGGSSSLLRVPDNPDLIVGYMFQVRKQTLHTLSRKKNMLLKGRVKVTYSFVSYFAPGSLEEGFYKVRQREKKKLS